MHLWCVFIIKSVPLSHAIKQTCVLKHFSCQNWCSSVKFAAWIVIVGAGFPGTRDGWCVAENVRKQSADCSLGPGKSVCWLDVVLQLGDALGSSRLVLEVQGWETKFSAEEKLLSQKRQIRTDLWVLAIRSINPPFVCNACLFLQRGTLHPIPVESPLSSAAVELTDTPHPPVVLIVYR